MSSETFKEAITSLRSLIKLAGLDEFRNFALLIRLVSHYGDLHHVYAFLVCLPFTQAGLLTSFQVFLHVYVRRERLKMLPLERLIARARAIARTGITP